MYHWKLSLGSSYPIKLINSDTGFLCIEEGNLPCTAEKLSRQIDSILKGKFES